MFHLETCWDTWERAVDWMTLTTKTRISNQKQVWRHNSLWSLLGKSLMECLICHRNEYVMYSVIGPLIFAPSFHFFWNLHGIAGNLSKRFPLCHPGTVLIITSLYSHDMYSRTPIKRQPIKRPPLLGSQQSKSQWWFFYCFYPH